MGVKNLEEILMDPWEGQTLSEQDDSVDGNEDNYVAEGQGGDFSKVPRCFHWCHSLAI